MQKIRTALLSYGMSGKVFHAPFLDLHPGFDLVGSWERSTKKIAEDYPDAKSYDTLEKLLFDDIDLVIVNTPVATHFEYAKKALLAGKHVLVEKAFTTNVAEAKELKALSEEKGLKLAVFQNRRWDSDFKMVRNIVESGKLGKIVEAELHFDRYNPQLSPKTHKETTNDGAGILKDLGPHLIDQALTLFGMPESLFADIRVTRAQSLVDDYIDILLFYPETRVRIKSGFFVMEPVPSYIFHGRKGSLLKPRGDVQEDDLKAGNKPSEANWGYEPETKDGILHYEEDGIITRKQVSAPAGNYYDFFDALYEAITEDKKVPVTAQDGVNVMKVIEASLESSQKKTIITLN